MGTTEARFAAMVADTIAWRGSVVTLKGGAAAFTMIVDENADTIKKEVGQETLQMIDGRPALFYMTAATFRQIPQGSIFLYDDREWSVNSDRSVQANGAVQIRTLLCYTGGNP